MTGETSLIRKNLSDPVRIPAFGLWTGYKIYT